MSPYQGGMRAVDIFSKTQLNLEIDGLERKGFFLICWGKHTHVATEHSRTDTGVPLVLDAGLMREWYCSKVDVWHLWDTPRLWCQKISSSFRTVLQNKTNRGTKRTMVPATYEDRLFSTCLTWTLRLNDATIDLFIWSNFHMWVMWPSSRPTVCGHISSFIKLQSYPWKWPKLWNY